MINLRFHIVSLVAVFLALAIGIAVGATVVDQGLVSQSQRRIASLDRTLEDRASAIRDLRNDNAALETFGEQAEDRMVSDRLLAKSVLFVTDGAIDDDRTAELTNTLRSSGARVLGTLAIGPSLNISAPQALERARVAVGATSTRPDTVRFLVGQRIIGAIGRPFDVESLQPLVAAGLIERRSASDDSFPEVIPIGTRVVFLRGQSSSVTVADASSWIGRLANMAPVVVVGGNDDPLVRQVRDVAALAARVSTVDDVDDRAGRVGTVYVLEDLGRGRVGHYGSADGAERLIPTP